MSEEQLSAVGSCRGSRSRAAHRRCRGTAALEQLSAVVEAAAAILEQLSAVVEAAAAILEQLSAVVEAPQPLRGMAALDKARDDFF